MAINLSKNTLSIGRKSIVKKIQIPVKGKNLSVLVQANKNYGICEIIAEGNRISEVLSEFQGRQINDEHTIVHLRNVLEEVLNTIK